ncbi:MAG: LytR C-terminal domain-containing protein [Coriobacteriia bacterium]|nr:LytR C-terminal domain-containing protein [Coriobacteriia bacterium]
MSRHTQKAQHARESRQVTGVVEGLRIAGFYGTVALTALLGTVCVLLLLGTAINGASRWNALRHGASTESGAAPAVAKATNTNVLVIGVKDGRATGFLALNVDRANDRVVGIAIPDGTFIEVPGQGIARVGDSYSTETTTAKMAMSAISNYLMVPFQLFIAVSADAYTSAVQGQSVAGLTTSPLATNLSADDLKSLARDFSTLPQKNTAIVPLPVTSIKLGNQTYLEPQRAQVADLLKSWWGVEASQAATATRVILYNGSGVPGIAGLAAQQLIGTGLHVVDTKNADNFNYAKTQVIVQRGALSQGDSIAKTLGVGTVVNQPADQDVAEVIVIIGKDYKPPKG